MDRENFFYFYITVEKYLPSVGIKIATCKLTHMLIILVLFVFLTVVTFTHLRYCVNISWFCKVHSTLSQVWICKWLWRETVNKVLRLYYIINR